MPCRVGANVMTEEIGPARRAGRRGPEVRCRTASSRAPAGAPEVPGAQIPAAPVPGVRSPGVRGPGGVPEDAVPDGTGALRVEVARVRGDAAVVAVTGEIDLRTADALRARLVEVHASGPRRLVADFAAVSFCDAAGLGALVAAHNRIAACGGEIALARVRPAQLRLLRITGLHRLFAVHPDVAGALAEHDSPSTSR